MAHCLNDKAETLLVVDDEEAIRQLEVRILSQLGYKVLEAEGPVEALQVAAATPIIHLLLTDYSMPQANGLELVQRFRTVHPKTPVLMVSASLEEIVGRADRLDRFAVLAKPFRPEDLVDRVRTLLSPATCHHATSSP